MRMLACQKAEHILIIRHTGIADWPLLRCWAAFSFRDLSHERELRSCMKAWAREFEQA